MLINYLTQGIVDDNVSRLFELLDYYNLYKIKTEYPEDYLKIKMRDDWFRSNLYRKGFEFLHRDQEFDLIELTEEMFNTWSLARNVRYLFFNGMSMRCLHKGQQFSSMFTIDYRKIDKPLSETEPTGDIPIGIELHIMYPTLQNTLFEYKSIVEASVKYATLHDQAYKTKEAVSQSFKLRDSLYNDNILRETHWRIKKENNAAVDGSSVECPVDIRQNFSDIKQRISGNNVFKTITKHNLWDNMVVAGGSICRMILGSRIPDYDIFIYGLDPSGATQKVREIVNAFCGPRAYIARTANSITISRDSGLRVQVILRLYKTKAEILKGFDLQSSQVLYDGSRILITPAGRYAFESMLNLIDFERMSPSYEYRLWKYQSIGFSVYIPDFNTSKINWKNVKTIHAYDKGSIKNNIVETKSYKPDKKDKKKRGHSKSYLFRRYKISPYKLQGLDLLLYGQKYQLGAKSDYDARITGIIREDSHQVFLSRKNKVNGYSVSSSKADLIFHYIPMNNREMEIPLELIDSWKTKNPGEQATGTFHATVYKDISLWYKGLIYDHEDIETVSTDRWTILSNKDTVDSEDDNDNEDNEDYDNEDNEE
jgi:hypothetical protein